MRPKKRINLPGEPGEVILFLGSCKPVVLKLGSAVLLGSARQIFWDREAPSKKIKTTILKKKFCVKLSFQATFLPINLTNTICHETLQAT